jgi:hypothetical protein
VNEGQTPSKRQREKICRKHAWVRRFYHLRSDVNQKAVLYTTTFVRRQNNANVMNYDAVRVRPRQRKDRKKMRRPAGAIATPVMTILLIRINSGKFLRRILRWQIMKHGPPTRSHMADRVGLRCRHGLNGRLHYCYGMIGPRMQFGGVGNFE